jgi:hypothetical protein
MKILPSEISKNGYVYRLVERDHKRAIYSQSIGSKIYAYEVFIVKNQKASSQKIGEQWIYRENSELFPNNEAFGKWAWTYPKLSQAKAKFYELKNRKEVKNV